MAGITGLLSAVAPILGSLIGGSPPSAPEVAEAPEAPTQSTAADIAPIDVGVEDADARRRAVKRNKSSREGNLFALEGDDAAVSLTKSLLGE